MLLSDRSTDSAMAVALDKTWQKFLEELDASLSTPVELICVGGFVLYAVYGIPRVTGDIDYLSVHPADAADELESLAGAGSKLAKKYKIQLQPVGGIADYPEDFAERAQELDLGLKNIRLLAVDPYDLLLSKLPRNSPKDRDDAKWLIQQLDLNFATMQERWKKEMAPWIANADRHGLTLRLWKEFFRS